MLDKFTTTDWLQLWGIIATLGTSIVAIAISIGTLRQNSKMIEESTRPYITVYSKYSDGIVYYIIKNFGSSAAYIDNIETDFFIPKEDNNMVEGNPFSLMCGATLVPGDSKLCPLIAHSLKKKDFMFNIKYHSLNKSYSENFKVNGDADATFPNSYANADTEIKALRAISHSLRDIRNTRF